MEKRTMIFSRRKKNNNKPTNQIQKRPDGIIFPDNQTLDKVRDFCHHYAGIRFGDIFSETLVHQTGEMLFSGWLLSNSIAATEQAATKAGDMSVLNGDLVNLASDFQKVHNHILDPDKVPFSWEYTKKPYTGH